MVGLSEAGGSDAVTTLRGYTGTFTLAEPAPQGLVQVWVEEGGVRRETITDYSLDGSPAYRHGRGAPTESSDGQVMIFGDGLIFDEGEFFALQAVSTIPAQPAGTTLIGRAYRLAKSAGAHLSHRQFPDTRLQSPGRSAGRCRWRHGSRLGRQPSSPRADRSIGE